MARKPKAAEIAAEMKEEPKAAEIAAELVRMVRTEPMHQGGPRTADVHPGEVENMRAHGWSVPVVEFDEPVGKP